MSSPPFGLVGSLEKEWTVYHSLRDNWMFQCLRKLTCRARRRRRFGGWVPEGTCCRRRSQRRQLKCVGRPFPKYRRTWQQQRRVLVAWQPQRTFAFEQQLTPRWQCPRTRSQSSFQYHIEWQKQFRSWRRSLTSRYGTCCARGKRCQWLSTWQTGPTSWMSQYRRRLWIFVVVFRWRSHRSIEPTKDKSQTWNLTWGDLSPLSIWLTSM